MTAMRRIGLAAAVLGVALATAGRASAGPAFLEIGASGNNAIATIFGTGDLSGSVTQISTPAFNALTPAQLRASYDGILVTWASDPAANIDWTTRLLPYIQAGGGVIYDGDPNHLSQLLPGVTGVNIGATGDVTITATVPGLTTGIVNDPGAFANRHIEFTAYDPNLNPFLTGSSDSSVIGLYGTFGAGTIVLTGPDQNFHATRGDNQYKLLMNEITYVTTPHGTTVVPEPATLISGAIAGLIGVGIGVRRKLKPVA